MLTTYTSQYIRFLGRNQKEAHDEGLKNEATVAEALQQLKNFNQIQDFRAYPVN